MKLKLNKNKIKKLEKTIKKSWNKDTCHPDVKIWSKKNPSKGQCGVTALVIQDYLGGRIVFNRKLRHIWNTLPNKKEYDLTKDQFLKKTKIEREGFISRENAMSNKLAINSRVKERYKILKKRVKEKLK